MNPLADPESQSSEKAAACPGFRLVSKSSLMSPDVAAKKRNRNQVIAPVMLLTSQQLKPHLTLYNNVIIQINGSLCFREVNRQIKPGKS